MEQVNFISLLTILCIRSSLQLNDMPIFHRNFLIAICVNIGSIFFTDFDWFQMPTSSTDYKLHCAFHALIEKTNWLRNLCMNRVGSYPGGSYQTLRLISFALTWARALSTKDTSEYACDQYNPTLRLGDGLTKSIRLWCCADGDEGALAMALWDDFVYRQCGFDLADPNVVDDTQIKDASFSVTGLIGLNETHSSSSDFSCHQATRCQNHCKTRVETVEEIKDEANKYFADGKFSPAFTHYKHALALLDQLVEAEPGSDFNALYANLHFNCAMCLWSQFKRRMSYELDFTLCTNKDCVDVSTLVGDDETCFKLLNLCESECRQAIHILPSYVKVVISF
jgi:hypothetical protein